jgi:hypothetical protein
MRFVLFDSIVNGECRIRDSWSRRGTPAFRYFLFQIAVALAAFASLGVLIGVPALLGFGMGLFENPRQHILALVLGGLLVGLLFLSVADCLHPAAGAHQRTSSFRRWRLMTSRLPKHGAGCGT